MNSLNSLCIILMVLYHRGYALDNGLALTPPMGWMHWQRFRCLTDCVAYPNECISENLFKAMADRLSEDGYLDAGYEYIMIDDCWMAKERDANGRLQPNATRFPSGIRALADYIHGKGLKFGIYADYGSKTCAGYPGSVDNLELDANTFAEWQVDYLKFDGCYYDDIINIGDGYQQMSQYLNKTGRPIVYSCSWPAYQEPLDIESDYAALAKSCNLWRNWDDIDDAWQSVTSILKWFSKNQERIQPFSGPGHWNDPDMLLIGNYGLSLEQSKAQMAIWAIMAAPLIMSVDLRSIRPEFKAILLNKNVIEINQDPLGIQGMLVTTVNKIDVWTKPMLPIGENGTKSYAIALLSNRVDGYPYRVNVTLNELKINEFGSYAIMDVYENQFLGFFQPEHKLWVRVKPSGVVLLKATPANQPKVEDSVISV